MLSQRGLFVIAMIGPVGSGKTHIAKMLARQLGARRLNTDAVRVALRRKHESESQAIAISHRRQERLLARGHSLILDYDHVNPARRGELQERLRPFEARAYFVRIETPERLILARLKRKRYTGRDLFKDAEEAIRIYHMRKRFHERPQRFSPDFAIDNTKPIEPQIEKIAETIKGL